MGSLGRRRSGGWGVLAVRRDGGGGGGVVVNVIIIIPNVRPKFICTASAPGSPERGRDKCP